MLQKVGKRLLQFGILRIVAILFLIGMCVYVKLPAQQHVSESTAEGIVNEENTGSVFRSHKAKQYFKFKDFITLNSVDVRFVNVDDAVNADYILMRIYQKRDSVRLMEQKVYMKDINMDGEMTRIKLEKPLELEAKRNYYIIFTTAKDDASVVTPALRLANFTYPNKRLYVAGSLVKNQTLDIVYNYSLDNEYNALGMYIAFMFMIILLFIPKWFYQRASKIQGLGWALFCANPVFVMMLYLGLYNLNSPTSLMRVLNGGLLLFIGCIMYAIIGNKYITIFVQNIICFALVIINIPINTFKGVPLAPSDFLFLKTAFAVSENYEITFTQRQLQYMAFIAAYMMAIFMIMIYHQGTKSPVKRVWRKWKSIRASKVPEVAEDMVKDADDAADGKGTEKVSKKNEKKLEKKISDNDSKEAEKKTDSSNDEDAKKFDYKKFTKKYYFEIAKVALRVAMLVIGCVGIHWLYTTDALKRHDFSVFIWDQTKSAKRNGYYMDFFLKFHYLFVQKPDGYSVKDVEAIVDDAAKSYAKDAPETGDVNAKTGSKDPNIIVIMNESLTDYTLLNNGANMAYNTDYLPYLHSLNENVIKGKDYVSVYGGQTANSEWECLTGNSMAYMPTGSVPYQQYLNGTSFSMPLYLESLGYKTLAIHPCVGTNWNRDVAYESMNFGAFLTQNDFVNPEYVRYISDRENYKKIYEQMENKSPDEKLFIMDVTMQNHGGYKKASQWQNPIIAGDGEFPLANEYLSSAHVSDQAFKELIEYFENYDEPTIILMFGDHQPKIEDEFVSVVLGGSDMSSLEISQEKYCTPFVIWANYPIDTETNAVSSNNFFSNMVLEQAGLPLSKYNQVIADVMKDVKAMNAFGYMTNDGLWHTYDEETEVSDKIRNYNIAEYGYFSDKDKEKMADIFQMILPGEK